MNSTELSIVIPLYNEEYNVSDLYQEICLALEESGVGFEIILVDDGSQDETFSAIADLAEKDSRVRVVRLRRNFGQTAAMAAGFKVCSGEVIVPMDGDLQNDPADIPLLLAKIRDGFDVVSGWRKNRKDTLISRRLPSVLANRLISRMTGVILHDYGCSLKAYRREVLSEVNLYGEMHRFIPALASQVGAKVTELVVNHRPRRAGVSKYGIDRTLRVILDLVTVKFLLTYSAKPLQLFGKWGIGIGFFGVVSGFMTLYMKFSEGLNMNRNPLLILSAFLLFSGVHLVCLGLLGELVTRTYFEAQDKPIYSVRETRNL